MDYSNSNSPKEVQFDLNEAKQLFMNEQTVEEVDPLFNTITNNLEQAVKQHEEQFRNQGNNYLFDHVLFVNSLEHINEDQLSALRKDKLTPQQFAERMNRWIVFCEAVVNMGITCVYSKAALEKEDYATVFGTLSINKVFETTFLKPHGIKVELAHKNPQIKEKFPWLAMPCLIVKDEQGNEHQIALTPGPGAEVWWLDILGNFHASFNWDYQALLDGEGLATSTIDNRYAPLQEEEEDEGDAVAAEEDFINPNFVAMAQQARKELNVENPITPEVVEEPQGKFIDEFATARTERKQAPPLPVEKQEAPRSSRFKMLGFFAVAVAFVYKLFRRK